MPPPKPPNRSEPSPFPVFGASWYGDPSATHGTSVVAFCGGGGSARTGVNNAIVILWRDEPPVHISTGSDVAVAVHVYGNPMTHNIFVMVGLEKRVERYKLSMDNSNTNIDDDPNGESSSSISADLQVTPAGRLEIGERVEAVTVHAMADRFAVGCDNGHVLEYSLTDDVLGEQKHYTYEGHQNTLCALQYSIRGDYLLSSAKDGTARVWKKGECTDVLVNDITSPKDPPPKTKRKPQVMVRGCCFEDLEGNVAITVASAKRGNAFLTRWTRQKSSGKLATDQRLLIHNMPVSSLSVSADAEMLALGTVDGSIKLFSIPRFKVIRLFPEVHGLPVTSIAARPFGSLPLPGEGPDDVRFAARSFSADGQAWCLTLQTKNPRQSGGGGSDGGLGGFCLWLEFLLKVWIVLWMLSPIGYEILEKVPLCRESGNGVLTLPICVWQEAILAPSTKPGIASVPR